MKCITMKVTIYSCKSCPNNTHQHYTKIPVGARCKATGKPLVDSKIGWYPEWCPLEDLHKEASK